MDGIYISLTPPTTRAPLAVLTNIDNHPKNGHSEEMGKDRMFDFEREYLATHPDLPVDYKKIIEKYHSPSLAQVLKLYLERNG